MIYEELLAKMKENADSEKAEKMSAYMRNQFEFLGIQSVLRRDISKEFLKELKKGDTVDWDFVYRLWDSDYREMQYIAAEYLKSSVKKMAQDDINHIKTLALKKSWWDTIDVLDRIAGELAFNYPQLNGTMVKWSTDENIWLRRIAIDHQLKRKEKTDTNLLEKILVNNLGETEFFINKAIGWSLREYSKTNPEWVRVFIDKYKDRLSNLSIREGSKYI